MVRLLEARFAGAEGVGAVCDAVRLVPVAAQGPVATAVVKRSVCGVGRGGRGAQHIQSH